MLELIIEYYTVKFYKSKLYFVDGNNVLLLEMRIWYQLKMGLNR